MLKKKGLLIYMCLITFIIAMMYIVLVKYTDVGAIAADGSNVGFSTINVYFKELIGYSKTWYKVSTYLGILPIAIAGAYALLGLYQLIKNKSLAKVDKKLYVLAGFYALFVFIYFLFEKVALNYRPVMIDGEVEASFPSTHTLLAVCMCGSSLLLSAYFIKNKKALKICNILTWLIMIALVVTRTISGVHWVTDILGGVIISLFMLMVLYTAIYYVSHPEKKER